MKKGIEKLQSQRVMYKDYLRVLAVFAVVIIHCVYSQWENFSIFSDDWVTVTIYDGLVRWSVPVFVMISGSLFLDNDRKLTNQTLYGKYILRIITALLFWSLVYGVYNLIRYDKNIFISGVDVTSKILSRCFSGSFHLWFLFMIIGLYIITPIVRKITESKDITKYFIIVTLVFTFIIPGIITEINRLDNSHLDILVSNYNKMNFHLTLGYVGYFVLGYYLSKYEISKKFRTNIYILGIVGFFATILLTIFVSRDKSVAIATYFDYLSVCVLLQSLGVFVFGKYILSKIKFGEKVNRIIIALSKYSFGVYLVHLLVIKLFESWGFNCLSLHSPISPLVFALAVFAVSMIISFVLNQIPFVKKYFV